MPKAVKWRLINKNSKVMFDLSELLQKKQELRLALAGNIGDYSDTFRDCYGCEGNCQGTCTGSCAVGCTGCGVTCTNEPPHVNP